MGLWCAKHMLSTTKKTAKHRQQPHAKGLHAKHHPGYTIPSVVLSKPATPKCLAKVFGKKHKYKDILMNRYAIYDTLTGKIDGWYSDPTDPPYIIRDAEHSLGVQPGRLQVIAADTHFTVPRSQVLRLSEIAPTTRSAAASPNGGSE